MRQYYVQIEKGGEELGPFAAGAYDLICTIGMTYNKPVYLTRVVIGGDHYCEESPILEQSAIILRRFFRD